MKLNRRTFTKLLAAIPWLGWIDPVRAAMVHPAALHYRANHDGRSLYIVLRDLVRNGVSHEDLVQILGPIPSCGRMSPTGDRFLKFDEGADIHAELSHGEVTIEYAMSYWWCWLKLRDGVLVDHDPRDFEIYPDGLYLGVDGLESWGRPPEAGPLPPSPTKCAFHCTVHGVQEAAIACAHLVRGASTGERVGFHCSQQVDDDRPHAWCDACHSLLPEVIDGPPPDEWTRGCHFEVCCAACWDSARSQTP